MTTEAEYRPDDVRRARADIAVIRSIGRMLRMPGSILFLIVIVCAIIGPTLTISPLTMNEPIRLQGPSVQHLLGTDEYGRDLLARLVYGIRIELTVSLISVGIGGVVGVLVGLAAGYYGGAVDGVLSRVVEALQAFPPVLLALLIAALVQPSLTHAMIAVGIVGIPDFTRITRGVVMATKELEYVEAARSVAAGDRLILIKHVLPACIPSLIVLATYNGANAVMWESSLSFLGIGAQPPTPALGAMLSSATDYLYADPAYAIVVGVVLSFIIIAINRFGDGLLEFMDPRLR